MKLFWLAGFFASIISPLQAQERKEVTITPLLSSTVNSSGQPIALPQKNAEVVVSIYDVALGAALPVQKHPYPMYAYVLSGKLRVINSETGRSNTYKAGAFILESVGQWHTGANIGDEPSSCWSSISLKRGKRTPCCSASRPLCSNVATKVPQLLHRFKTSSHMSDQLAVIEAHTLNCRRRSPMWCVSLEIEIQAIKNYCSAGSPPAAGRKQRGDRHNQPSEQVVSWTDLFAQTSTEALP